MAAVPVSSLPGPGPPPQSTEVAAAAVVFSATFSRLGHRQQQHLARGRAWRGVATGGDLHRHGDHDLHHRWARHKERQPSEGELLQRAPHNITTISHFSHTFPSWSDETEERRLVEEEGS